MPYRIFIKRSHFFLSKFVVDWPAPEWKVVSDGYLKPKTINLPTLLADRKFPWETPFLAPLAALLEMTYQKSIREPDQTLPTPLMPLPPRKMWVIVVSSWPLVAQLDMAPQTAAIQSEDGDKHVNIFSVDIEIPICVSSIWIRNFFIVLLISFFSANHGYAVLNNIWLPSGPLPLWENFNPFNFKTILHISSSLCEDSVELPFLLLKNHYFQKRRISSAFSFASFDIFLALFWFNLRLFGHYQPY